LYNAKNGNGAEPKYSDARPTDICIIPSSEFAVGVKSNHAETVTLDVDRHAGVACWHLGTSAAL
jgi:hypothetical protein